MEEPLRGELRDLGVGEQPPAVGGLLGVRHPSRVRRQQIENRHQNPTHERRHGDVKRGPPWTTDPATRCRHQGRGLVGQRLGHLKDCS